MKPDHKHATTQTRSHGIQRLVRPLSTLLAKKKKDKPEAASPLSANDNTAYFDEIDRALLPILGTIKSIQPATDAFRLALSAIHPNGRYLKLDAVKRLIPASSELQHQAVIKLAQFLHDIHKKKHSLFEPYSHFVVAKSLLAHSTFATMDSVTDGSELDQFLSRKIGSFYQLLAQRFYPVAQEAQTIGQFFDYHLAVVYQAVQNYRQVLTKNELSIFNALPEEVLETILQHVFRDLCQENSVIGRLLLVDVKSKVPECNQLIEKQLNQFTSFETARQLRSDYLPPR